MNRFINLIIFLSFTYGGYGQDPNKFVLSIKDTLRSYSDCVLYVKILRTDNKLFKFPENYYFGSDDDLLADLQIKVEKIESPTKSVEYICKEKSLHSDAFEARTSIYKSAVKLTLTDSLTSLYCLDKGAYRIQVLYNKKNRSKTISWPNIVGKSNWCKIYVTEDLITLNRYWLEKSLKSH